MPSVKMSQREAELRKDGYVNTVDNRGMLDTIVLTKDQKVIRLGTDPAIDVFVTYIRSQSKPSFHLPVILNHGWHDPLTPFAISNEGYYETELELLLEISDSEIRHYREWISDYDCAIRKGSTISDFHGLLSVVQDLEAYAAKMKVVPDFKQAKNLMKREGDGRFVIIDAFA